MNENKILVLDIETTGFSHDKNHIIEIGVTELDLTNGNKTIIFDQLFYEKTMTFRELMIRTRLEGLELDLNIFKEAVNLERKKEELQEIFNSYPLGATAFNKSFDFGFLENRGFVFPKKLDCPMLLSTPICKLSHKKGRAGYKWPKVEEAFKYFFPGSDYIETHRGGDDSLHEAAIVYELYKLGVFKV